MIVSRRTPPSRFRSGRCGRGWSDNWDYALAVASDGTVTINGPSGSRRIFQPDNRGPNIFVQAADYATLSKGGAGSYIRQEGSGIVYIFNQGLLQSVQDTHANLHVRRPGPAGLEIRLLRWRRLDPLKQGMRAIPSNLGC